MGSWSAKAFFGEDFLGDPESRRRLGAPWKFLSDLADGDAENLEHHAKEIEDRGSIEKNLSVDHQGRLVLELLQNAHDACADANVSGKAWMAVSDSAFLVANEGVPFDSSRVDAMLRLASSSKSARDQEHETIGYKGVGFTSVFEITSAPQIISNGLCFCFDAERAKAEVERFVGRSIRGLAVKAYPFPLKREGWEADASLIDFWLESGAATIIRLPFKSSEARNAVIALLEECLSPITFALLPQLSELEVDDRVHWSKSRSTGLAGGEVVTVVDVVNGNSRSWHLSKGQLPVSPSLISDLDNELWRSVNSIGYAIGLPWDAGGPVGSKQQPLYTYFSTEESTNRGIVIHADFYLDTSRLKVNRRGAAAKLLQATAQAIAEHLASILPEVVRQHPDRVRALMDAVAVQSVARGAGSELNKAIDQWLRLKPFLPASDGGLVAPEEATQLNAELGATLESQVATLVPDRAPLVVAGLSRKGRSYVADLGATQLTKGQVLSSIDPESAPSYDALLDVVRQWWEACADQYPRQIDDARILKSVTGGWSTPDEIFYVEAGLPSPPRGMTIEEYAPPRKSANKDFVLDVAQPKELDLESLLDLVADACSAGTVESPLSPSVVHSFALKVFKKHAKQFREHRLKKNVQVRARRGHPEAQKAEWRLAEEVYFPEPWSGSSALEVLYGGFEEAEFLARHPPENAKERRRLFEFYSAIGVVARPREVLLSNVYRAPRDYRQEPKVRDALSCPEGHSQTPQVLTMRVLDRLEEILDDMTPHRAEALVSVLASSNRPYGDDGYIQCSHSSHNRGRKTRRAVPSVQRWLLMRSPWVPVETDGKSNFTKPERAWFNVDGARLRGALAVAKVPKKVARKLELSDMERPSSQHLVAALDYLSERFPDLDDAPTEIVDSADLLMLRLEQRLPDALEEHVPPRAVPAYVSRRRCWSEAPVVVTETLPESLEIEALAPGPWPKVGNLCCLQTVSDRFEVSLTFEESRLRSHDLLPTELCPLILVLLRRGGVDAERAAAFLGRAEVFGVPELSRSYRLGDELHSRRTDVGIHPVENDGGECIFVASDADAGPGELIAKAVAQYLGAEGDAWLSVEHVLTNGVERSIKNLKISIAELEESEELLARYSRAQLETDDVEEISPLENEDSSNTDDGVRSEPIQAPAEMVEPVVEQPSVGADSSQPPSVPTSDASTALPSGDDRGSTPRAPSRATRSRGTGARRKSAGIAVGSRMKAGVTFSSPRPIASSGGSGGSSSGMMGATGALGGTGASGEPGLTDSQRREVELAAMQKAEAFGRFDLGATEVIDVSAENKGWDLEFHGLAEGPLLVEVKGFGSRTASSFILTRNERLQAIEQSRYRIILVTGVKGTEGDVWVLDPMAQWVDAADTQPMSWSFDGWQAHVDTLLSRGWSLED